MVLGAGAHNVGIWGESQSVVIREGNEQESQ